MEWAVLLFIFDGDAASWAQWVEENGSAQQRLGDLELARSLARRLEGDEPLRRALRVLARELNPPPN